MEERLQSEGQKQRSKTVRQAKTYKILKVVISHPKASPKMKSCKCTDCGKSFKERSALGKHLKSHAPGERPYNCVACGKNFTKKSSLVIHQRTHVEGKCFACKKCGKTFGQRSNLLIHHKVHTQKKGNGSKNVTCVSVATKEHGKEKPYKCLECKKMFVLNKNLIKHQKMHSREVSHSRETACRFVEEGDTAEEQAVDYSGLMLEELTRMRENVDMLLLNQQSQLQVLQGIQKQLGILLPVSDLMNSNVYNLGLLLQQQAAAMGLPSSPLLLLSPSNLLPEGARPFSSHV